MEFFNEFYTNNFIFTNSIDIKGVQNSFGKYHVCKYLFYTCDKNKTLPESFIRANFQLGLKFLIIISCGEGSVSLLNCTKKRYVYFVNKMEE